MKRFLLIAAIAVMAGPSVFAAAECKTDPKPHIKQTEQSIKAQQSKLSKDQARAVNAAINKAKMAVKFGNNDTACESLEPIKATLGLNR